MAENPFSHPSRLPYEFPPFDRVNNAHYRPAFDAGMQEQRAEVRQIVENPAAADFQNTVVALERSGRMLSRVSSVFFNLNASNTDAEMLEIDSEIAPKLQAHDDSIFLDPALFARVDAVYQRRAGLNLDSESLQLLNRYYIEFVRAGARLADGDKARLREINGELSSLTTSFK
jgi:peptidyl-dipeptidase Dcp